jgi:hypothetical protein
MNVSELSNKFGRMGARVMVEPFQPRFRSDAATRINIRSDRQGEYFHLMVNPDRLVSLEVLDVRPEQRHLLLMARQRPLPMNAAEAVKQKFLCGHDERSWFVAAVPEKASASTVKTAMEALKPPAVLMAQEQAGLDGRQRLRRKNRAFVRQGEWFFIPQPTVTIDARRVLRNEPLRRGAGKPHWAEHCFRTGGETVYVSQAAPNGFTDAEYRMWLDRNPTLRGKVSWTVMRRDAEVYVRGRVRHPDHKTIVLSEWHLVQMNTETQAQAMRHVAFLD